ncbi:Six-hairpin glycosidase-like protein [Rhodotorula diobovata]|uniref:Six-hairpin glycosidase-like protein n=2 Tax=Rhodotorula diobovata TaxID=5288 RepID=A0A5C5G561_9BASI|nr:Six-hairpin glycosidase-like protein [Rhodotorula diobovata]
MAPPSSSSKPVQQSGAPSSFTARKMSNAGQGPLPTLSIPTQPATAASSEPAGDVPLKQTAVPREASAPNHNATASPLPAGASPGVTPPLSTASATRPLGRSGTLKGSSASSRQAAKPRDSNISEDQGYEGDFKADDSDEAPGDKSASASSNRRPKLASQGSSGDVKARDHASGGAPVKPQAAVRNSPAAHEGIRASLPADFPDAESFARSMQRNRNPSASAYSHPGKLPYGRNKNSGGGPPKARSPSMTSQRSVEATSHPFPTPGLKKQDGFQFDQWKSLEEQRLDEDERKEKHWKRWGPYVSERQWATVREDYSANGDAWTHFPHEHARSRAYRWGEDGLAGISDNHGRLCLSVALWNGVDPILKERMFGTTGHQGNHGEDVKELYWYLDSTPTHSYMKMLYKYPQRPYPYEQLVRESTNRGRDVEEYEITDTDAFDDNRYWDVFVEYAKDEDCAEGVSIRITAYNRGPEPATLHIVPQLWFRNTWSWPKERPTGPAMPSLRQVGEGVVQADHEKLGRYYFHANSSPAPIGPRGKKEQHETVFVDDVVTPELLFTDNDTNFERLYGGKNAVPYVKDAFHDHIIPSHRPPMPEDEGAEATTNGEGYDSDTTQNGTATPRPEDTRQFVNPNKEGTKCGAHYVFRDVPGNGGCAVVRLKLTTRTADEDPAILDEENFDGVVEDRRMDSDEFYSRFNSGALSDDLRNVMRQALSGMLWTKQFYMFIQKEWIEGDPGQPPPPPERKNIRNKEWKHMHIEDILSMPDKWEYPFFAIWDSAFHCIPLAMIDPAYAKKQLDIMTREWYMKPDGALPAYEWNFGDVNPPVHAWATFRVFKIERKMHGREDIAFLERVFQKLLINFTWWVNRKDASGENVFEGGFLGLDNISPFNRSEQLPTGGTMRQADGTGWMGFYALTMLNIALELAKHNSVYEDIASKFFEHFLFISDAMTFHNGESGEVSLWNDETGFYFDAITWGPDSIQQIPVRSLVGLIPMYATLTLEPSTIKRFPGFKKRMDWFLENRSSISKRNIANMSAGGKGDRRLLALANEDRLRRILERMLDENEFLSEYGIRSLSRHHKEHPWSWNVNGEEFSVHFWPGDSHSGMFGGNSNWRGPIWLATTFLLIESLQRFYQYYGNEFKIECPTGSGDMHTLAQVAEDIQHRVIHLFARDNEGNRACNGGSELLNKDPHFRDYVPFHEFFNCETGKGLGASHQTGWTGLVAYFIWSVGSTARLPRTPRTPRSVAAHYFDDVATPGASEAETSAWDSDYSAAELDIDEL